MPGHLVATDRLAKSWQISTPSFVSSRCQEADTGYLKTHWEATCSDSNHGRRLSHLLTRSPFINVFWASATRMEHQFARQRLCGLQPGCSSIDYTDTYATSVTLRCKAPQEDKTAQTSLRFGPGDYASLWWRALRNCGVCRVRPTTRLQGSRQSQKTVNAHTQDAQWAATEHHAYSPRLCDHIAMVLFCIKRWYMKPTTCLWA